MTRTHEERAREICEAALYAFHNALTKESLNEAIVRHLREVEAEAATEALTDYVQKHGDEPEESKRPPAWIPCSERMPTEKDYIVHVVNLYGRVVLVPWNNILKTDIYWMPTNLTKPEPPKETTK